MAVEVIMPKFGLTMQEGTIRCWLRAEGEPVTKGEPLFEVETEKVLYEVEAPASGILARVLAAAETTVPVAQAVGVIAEAGEDAAAVAARYGAGASAPATTSAADREGPVEPPPPHVSLPGAPPERTAAPGPGVVATPAARKLARERGIDLATVRGSGPGGRITREDVEQLLGSGGSTA
jgi:pyruvate dehydrogenase E2 component (dihydrolipoamide acetyltransferase)